MAAYLNGSTVNVTVNDQPQRYTGAYTTEHFLRILGVSPIIGRDFTADDNKPGAEKVALIGYGIWQRDFGGAAGHHRQQASAINGKPATIIGVMPKGFAFPTNEELWIPLYSEFPPTPRNDPRGDQPGGARPVEARRRRSIRRTRNSPPSPAASPPTIRRPTSSSTPARSSR